MGGGLVGPGFAPFTPPSSPETKPADSPKLPTQQLQRSTSCPGLGRPIADRFVLDLNITDINAKIEPELEPQLPPTPKSEINTREVMINNRLLKLPVDLAKKVESDLNDLRKSPEFARIIKKDLLLNPSVLIELINDTKFSIQKNNPELFFKAYCEKIEKLFIENHYLETDEEKDLVRQAINQYKNLLAEELGVGVLEINADYDNNSDKVVVNASKTCNPCSIM